MSLSSSTIAEDVKRRPESFAALKDSVRHFSLLPFSRKQSRCRSRTAILSNLAEQ